MEVWLVIKSSFFSSLKCPISGQVYGSFIYSPFLCTFVFDFCCLVVFLFSVVLLFSWFLVPLCSCYLLFSYFPLILHVFPSGLTCYLDLFLLIELWIRYTTDAFIVHCWFSVRLFLFQPRRFQFFYYLRVCMSLWYLSTLILI